jgi:hypothetical protein
MLFASSILFNSVIISECPNLYWGIVMGHTFTPNTLGGGASGQISIVRISPSMAATMSSLDMAHMVALRIPLIALNRWL